MTENRVFLIGLFVFAAITVVIALLVGPDWMNWGGWRWISTPWAVFVGIWMGWSIKTTNARPRYALVDRIARCTDPKIYSLSMDQAESELEAWASVIRQAKVIAGDNAPVIADEDEDET